MKEEQLLVRIIDIKIPWWATKTLSSFCMHFCVNKDVGHIMNAVPVYG